MIKFICIFASIWPEAYLPTQYFVCAAECAVWIPPKHRAGTPRGGFPTVALCFPCLLKSKDENDKRELLLERRDLLIKIHRLTSQVMGKMGWPGTEPQLGLLRGGAKRCVGTARYLNAILTPWLYQLFSPSRESKSESQTKFQLTSTHLLGKLLNYFYSPNCTKKHLLHRMCLYI